MTIKAGENENEANTVYEDLQETMIELEADDEGDAPLVSNRDESGRFKPKEKVDPEASEPAATETQAGEQEQAGTWTHTRPPSSWTPKAREDWDKIPEHLRIEITRREEAQAKGAAHLHQQYAPAKAFVERVKEPMMEAIGPNGDPVQHVLSMMQVEKTLRTAPLPQKFNQLMAMADQFGIPLREIINASVGEEVLRRDNTQQAIPDAVQRELQEIRSWREQSEQSLVNQEVSQYGASLEFFEDVRGNMADLIETGQATDLNDAYEKAIWLNPDVRVVMLERHGKNSASSQVTARQAKAVGATVKPSGGISVATDDYDDNDSIGDTLRKAMSASQGRL
jgi:hypothetical protein